MNDTIPDKITGQWALDRYQQVRSRLPEANFTTKPVAIDSLARIADEFDAFVFDSFGVLNVGDRPIPGARERIDELRAGGKTLAILTNAATVPLAGLEAKYAAIGFDFHRREIISSREVLAEALAGLGRDNLWGIAAPPEADIGELPARCRLLEDDQATYRDCDGFILLSSQGWDHTRHSMLADALARQPRPLLVGNPDIVAPRERAITLEPGCYAHALADALAIEPVFYGKPFGNAFAMVEERIGPDTPRHRIAMIGDSPHTDILGAAAAGWRTVLVTGYGLVKDMTASATIGATGIVPDFIVPSI